MPRIVIKMVATNVNHGIDGTGPTEHFAAWPVQTAPGQLGLFLGGVGPVTRAFEKLGERYGDMDFALLVGAARLQQKHAGASLFRESVRQDTPGRPRADDDVVHHGKTLALLDDG